ncbi:glycosidase [Dehalococcoidia bacterium]|nr:glycosidase [Dehalococcoidia bacterium]
MKLIRYEGNPILKPRGYDWESVAVFNPAVVYKDGRIHLLYRAIADYQGYVARLGHAVFDERLNLVERSDAPCFGPDMKLWENSIEDARLSEIDGELYMTYVVTPTPTPPSGVRIRLGIPNRQQAITRIALVRVDKDFRDFTRMGIITPYAANERDTVLFPARINGKYAALHRPATDWFDSNYSPELPSIWFAYLDSLNGGMSGHKLVMEPKEEWESYKVGAGAPPIRTERGWLMIYHGVDKGRVYRAGAVLLDLEEPWKVVARTTEPILEPEEEYERIGDMPNVVFPEGAVVIGEDLLVFYGGADKVCCVASVRLNELVDHLLEQEG